MQDAPREKKQKVDSYVEDDGLNALLQNLAATSDVDSMDDRQDAETALLNFARESAVDSPSSESAAPPPDAPPDQPTPEDSGKALSMKVAFRFFLEVATEDQLKDSEIVDRRGHQKEKGHVADLPTLQVWEPKGFVNLCLTDDKWFMITENSNCTRNSITVFLGKDDSLPIVDILNALSNLPEPEDGVVSYIHELVDAVPKDYANMLVLPPDRTKGAALVVAGESGSGKSWFVQHTLRNRVIEKQNSVFLYHCLADNELRDDNPCPKLEKHDKEVAHVLGQAMRVLHNNGIMVGKVYDMLSERSMSFNKTRNDWAKKLLYEIIERKLRGSDDRSRLLDWWAGRDEGSVKRLVLALDEGGKDLDFARGLVDGVRCIYADLALKGVAPTVMLCVSGSGLERVIDIDSSHCGMGEMAALGTDPMKSNVIVLTRPSIDKLPKTLVTKAIQKGTYSRILSTNTRMLTRGVMPILNEQKFWLEVSNMEQRLIDLGSTNIVMDYAARLYFNLNGLKNISPEGRERLLLQAFQYLVVESARSGINPVSKRTCEMWTLDANALNHILSKGLVAADALNTSNALRYLACDGQTFPFIPADGMSLEIVLKLHLCRLQKVMSFDYMHYNLLEAWPPKSTKGDKLLADKEVIEKELLARYMGHAFEDIPSISQMIKKMAMNSTKSTAVVVMGQKNPTAQGPDVMVLSICLKDSALISATLDLYQAKNYSASFGVNTLKLRKSVQSLGISIRDDKNPAELHPNKGSAGYSYLGIQCFTRCLEKELGVPVEIRSRVLVVSMPLKTMKWSAKDFTTAAASGFELWTKEQMEPTISALVLAPAEPPDDLDNDDDMSVLCEESVRKVVISDTVTNATR
jgi:hypothetical protein